MVFDDGFCAAPEGFRCPRRAEPKTTIDMKPTIPQLISGTILVTALALTGCATGGSKSGASTSSGMAKAGQGVEALATQTDVTMAALNDITMNPGNLSAQFKTYDSAVKKLTSQFNKAVEQTASMKEKAQAYFGEWQTSSTNIVNEDIRKINTERLEKVKNAFKEVDESLKKVKEDFNPFLSDLNDVRQALSLDLTPDGVKALSGIAEKAMPKGQKLKESLTDAASDVKALADQLAPLAQQPAPE
jgi:ABC-type transporter Mla subunit MlaD